jgi:CheY-like chemotaxis protein
VKRRVLDVGNCAMDHGNLHAMLSQHFDVEIDQVHSAESAQTSLASKDYDLVTINRVFDQDGSYGIDLIKIIKANPKYASIPVMMITNFPDHQAQAIQAGAIPGFGKKNIRDPSTVELLRPYLTAQ